MSTRNAQPATYDGGRNQQYDTSEALSLIDRHSSLDGTYRSNRDLRIEGEVKGNIECRGTLHVAQGARVDAQVEAENIVVAGELSGEINCRGRLQLMPTGRLRGRVSTQTLVINEGAIYEGQLEMANPDTGGRLATMTSSAPRPITSGVSSQGQRTPQAAQSAPSMTAVEPAEAPAAIPAPAPIEARPRLDQPAPSSTSTFIRRFGGPETPFEGNRDNQEQDDEER